MEKQKGTRVKRIISIIAVVFFVFSLLMLLFATLAVKADSSFFGYRFYYVTTPSMEPDIMTGSLIVVKETPISELKVGDTISFYSRDPDIRGRINTHNIYEINYEGDSPVFTTKGTNNQIEDQYPVHPEDIKGRVIYDSLTLGRIFAFLSKRWVSFCLTVLPIAVIVLINFVDLIKVIHFFPDDEKSVENNENSDQGGNHEKKN